MKILRRSNLKSISLTKASMVFLGLLLVLVGTIGIFVPGLPTTIFLIGAAACFAKSSPRLHTWLLTHKWFGSTISAWMESRSIPKRSKIFALLMMFLACVYTWLIIDSMMVKLIISFTMLIPIIIVWRLPLSDQ